jgi:aerobic carbon-monoxide dehydrogenase large subunit
LISGLLKSGVRTFRKSEENDVSAYSSSETSLIGASLLRKEDARHLNGYAQFIADIKLPRMRDVAFLRSDVAHGYIKSIQKPKGYEQQIYIHGDLPIENLEAGPELAAFRTSPYPPFAHEKVRYVGQIIASALAPNRAQAEDLVEEIEVKIEELPAVVDVKKAIDADAPRLFVHWPDNLFIKARVDEGDHHQLRSAPIRLHRQFKMNRQATVSLEGRGVLAYWDKRADQLIVHLSTQGPHIMRIGLAQALNVPQSKIRVIAPDIGGGFGGKNRLMPEEIAVAAMALRVDYPLRWIEDRREHLMASVHARDHYYDLIVSADHNGRILGIEGDVFIDAGAYALWPTGSFMEASMAARNLPGPYDIKNLAITNYTVATNKAPMGPYRGVARPGACFAIERLIDEVAHHLSKEPIDIRRLNMIKSSQFPYQTVGGYRLDNGDYQTCLERAIDLIGFNTIRDYQKSKASSEHVRRGVGFAFYSEQSGHGTAEWTKRKSRIVPGYESARIKLNSDGSVIIHIGAQNHGQGHETTLAQIAAFELGLDPHAINIDYGDTAIAPFGFGSFASRTIVFSGGAVAKASRAMADKIKKIGAHLLQTHDQSVFIKNGFVCAEHGEVSFSEIARAATIRQELLPPDVNPLLEFTLTYEPSESSGVFSYGTHAVVVDADQRTGNVKIIDYVVVEDCGVMINPMIVDGQISGGVVQGIGTALFEEIPYSDNGQPLATTFADYMVPTASDIPTIRIYHMLTPATTTEYGVKGVGEGGAIAPPAAIANAIADAFREINIGVNETPLTSQRIVKAIMVAEASQQEARRS